VTADHQHIAILAIKHRRISRTIICSEQMATLEQPSPLPEVDPGASGTWDEEPSEIQEDAVPAATDPSSSSGQSVYDADSVMGESGRTYHGYKQGKYYLPNDSVSPPGVLSSMYRTSPLQMEQTYISKL
jgi:hypothetical protein